jgi:hypothetical protein
VAGRGHVFRNLHHWVPGIACKQRHAGSCVRRANRTIGISEMHGAGVVTRAIGDGADEMNLSRQPAAPLDHVGSAMAL